MMDARRRFSLILISICCALFLLSRHFDGEVTSAQSSPREWPTFGGNPERTQYSELAQINAANVNRLKPAWVYHTGDRREDDRSQIQCNPIIIDGVLYATSAQLKVFALKAATGEHLWTFDPFKAGAQQHSLGVNRGVVCWGDENDRRIFVCAGQRLYALDARTGEPITAFGNNGSIDLRDGLGRDVSSLYVLSNTPGVIFNDLLILGTRVSEGPGPSAPGHIRAYDARTGKIRWTFHTIPWPGEFGFNTWPEDAWKRVGGANAWAGMSIDVRRGLVFIPTGSAAFDFWGGDRKGANLFANCLLALDARTGRRKWHFQFVHHDLWDRDLPQAPVLITVRRRGRSIDAVAQATKSGHIFVFDRVTGRPLFPIQERRVPSSDLAGEKSWPTQPFPIKPPPFSRQTFTEADVTDISPEARAYALERLRKAKPGQPFMPPSKEGTIIFPGFDGGAEWGGSAFDPESGRLYVNANEMPWILTMVEVPAQGAEKVYRQHCAACHGIDRRGSPQSAPSLINLSKKMNKATVQQVIEKGKGFMPSYGFLSESERKDLLAFLFDEAKEGEAAAAKSQTNLYTHTGYNRFLDKEGYPAVKPPWGTLNAVNLNTGRIDWQVPLGEFAELTRRGIPQTGTENYGGPIVTAGGLVFIAATSDEKFRAFDKNTGRLLWEYQLPAGGYATPSAFEIDGKQYIVIAAGGGKMGTKSGDAYIAFALPD
jgi:quinoprotein glucose dehydrogenase